MIAGYAYARMDEQAAARPRQGYARPPIAQRRARGSGSVGIAKQENGRLLGSGKGLDEARKGDRALQ